LISTWPGPVGETYLILPSGVGPFSFSGQRRHHLHNRSYRSHASSRAETLQRNCGLSCRARLWRRLYCAKSAPVSHTTELW